MPPEAQLPEWMDVDRARKIVKLRALGFQQAEIAEQVGVSQQTVSRYLKGINEAAEESSDSDAFLAGLIIGAIGVAIFAAMMKRD